MRIPEAIDQGIPIPAKVPRKAELHSERSEHRAGVIPLRSVEVQDYPTLLTKLIQAAGTEQIPLGRENDPRLRSSN